MKTESCVIKAAVYENNKDHHLIAEVEVDLFTKEGINLLDTFLKTYEDYVGRENVNTYNAVWEVEIFSSIPELKEHMESEISKSEYKYDYFSMLGEEFYGFTMYNYDKIRVGAFIFLLKEYPDSDIEDLLFIVNDGDYDYIEKTDYKDMGKDIAEITGLWDELDNYNAIDFFDFEAYAKQELKNYTYLDGYGYYIEYS